MAYCRACGKTIDERASYCPSCGAKQDTGYTTTPPGSENNYDSEDTGSFGWGVLGYFIPVAGLVLYLVWKDQKPRTASIAGKGALISVIVSFAFGLIGTCVAASGSYY